MISYNGSGLSASELASLKPWNIPDVSVADEADALPGASSEPVDFEAEPMPALTVEEIEAVQKQAYDEAFAQGEKAGLQLGY